MVLTLYCHIRMNLAKEALGEISVVEESDGVFGYVASGRAYLTVGAEEADSRVRLIYLNGAQGETRTQSVSA